MAEHVFKADKKRWFTNGAVVGVLIQVLHYEDYINYESAYNVWRLLGSVFFGGIIGVISAYCHDNIYFKRGSISTSTARMRIAISIFSSWVLLIAVLLIVFGSAWVYSQFNNSSTLKQLPHSIQTEEDYVDDIIHEHGLEGVLKQIAQKFSLPLKIDDITTLSKINISGNLMQRIYVVNSSKVQFSPEFRKLIDEEVCKNEGMTLLITRGAMINNIYIAPDGQIIGQQLTNKDSCGL